MIGSAETDSGQWGQSESIGGRNSSHSQRRASPGRAARRDGGARSRRPRRPVGAAGAGAKVATRGRRAGSDGSGRGGRRSWWWRRRQVTVAAAGHESAPWCRMRNERPAGGAARPGHYIVPSQSPLRCPAPSSLRRLTTDTPQPALPDAPRTQPRPVAAACRRDRDWPAQPESAIRVVLPSRLLNYHC